ncbi:bifunctional 2-polyprenyl-6-hydroxyphenol methylase/3-demethylubiquinol 3-O-methyltransferase UbiG [Bradyrhizobium sp. CSS354]|uniref:class I SAM-dependent methyltransferase n=1 Tax=Bradyrhizobium sp. CSS354 TaxID=2699172 RepID=UPI0023AFAA29|nr:methyltransferase domain-containing protein [Bradyrhizobium sp. CSS354]MDE5466302.1 methyltransferase domain-containing protein [Bradyrhizobium sp. CSS354]
MQAATFATWYLDRAKDLAMADGHVPYWRHFIEIAGLPDLSTSTVMDFGCHRGGFLRLLHAHRPFKRGIGVDIATEAIAAAEAARGAIPVDYEVTDDLSPYAQTIDFGFSYEAIYLVPDIQQHALDMFACLKPGGVYYAVTGYHTESPLWQYWKESITANCNATIHDHAPNDYVAAFADAGFAVGVKRFGFEGFVQTTKSFGAYRKITDAIANHADYKLLFRLEKCV